MFSCDACLMSEPKASIEADSQKLDVATRAEMGGKARAESLSPAERKEIAQKGARARWDKPRTKAADGVVAVPDADTEPVQGGEDLPTAVHRGILSLMGLDLPCYVLSTGQRIIGRTSITEMLTGIKGGGALEKYIGVSALKSYVNADLVLEKMVAFGIPEVEGLGKAVKGLEADALIDMCQGFVTALDRSMAPGSGVKLTARQMQMAVRASMFVSACAKVGLDALIDEATGYQYERAEDALQIKLRAYLSDEMRKWEKTFPDELWMEFGRLTKWGGPVTKRPKYWGKLVIELVYEYLDPDVAKWLKDNAPKPRKGQNYHQWLSSQFGLKKLVEHIWMLVGIAKTCESMPELRQRMAELNGRVPIQMKLFVPASMVTLTSK